MLVSVSPAFAEAELEYRRRRIESDFGMRQRHSRPVRRIRFAELLRWGRRPNPAPPDSSAAPALRPSPHHVVSRG